MASLMLLLTSLLLTPIVAAPTSGKSKSKNLDGQVKASPRAAAATGGGSCCPISKWHGGGGRGGMNPRSILTGLGGQRGKALRWMVYDGALRLEDGVHAIVRDALADYLLRNAATAATAGGGGGGARQRL